MGSDPVLSGWGELAVSITHLSASLQFDAFYFTVNVSTVPGLSTTW